jgi:hypothetical protein
VSITTTRRVLRRLFDEACDAAEILKQHRQYQSLRYNAPDPLVLWARELLTPGANQSSGGGTTLGFGTYRIDLFAPTGAGTRLIDDAAQLVRAAFAPGAKGTTDGLWLAIDSASVQALYQDDRTITQAIAVVYRTHTFSGA